MLLFHSSKYSFIKFKNVEKYVDDALVSRYNNYLTPLKQLLEEFKKFMFEKAKAKKKIVYYNAKKLYSKLLSIYYDDYSDITDEQKEKIGEKYNPKNLLLKGQRFIESKKEEKSKSHLEETITERVKLRRQKACDKDSSDPTPEGYYSDEFIDMPQLEGDEKEVKEGKGLKVLTPNRLLTRLPILLAQINEK